MDNSSVPPAEAPANPHLRGWERPYESTLMRRPYLILRVAIPPNTPPIYWALKMNDKTWQFIGGFDNSQDAVYACNSDRSKEEWGDE